MHSVRSISIPISIREIPPRIIHWKGAKVIAIKIVTARVNLFVMTVMEIHLSPDVVDGKLPQLNTITASTDMNK